MFETPFSLPSDSVYKKLGLEPTATSAEIGNAINTRSGELNRELADLQSSLDNIYNNISDLKATQTECDALEKSNDNPEKLAKVKAKLQQLEIRAVSINPEYHQLKQRHSAINNEILDLNGNPLTAAERRNQYNNTTSLFALLQLAPNSYDFFSDNRATVNILRTDFSVFLEAQHEPVYYPSDLMRRTFELEFSPNKLLDGFDDNSG